MLCFFFQKDRTYPSSSHLPPLTETITNSTLLSTDLHHHHPSSIDGHHLSLSLSTSHHHQVLSAPFLSVTIAFFLCQRKLINSVSIAAPRTSRSSPWLSILINLTCATFSSSRWAAPFSPVLGSDCNGLLCDIILPHSHLHQCFQLLVEHQHPQHLHRSFFLPCGVVDTSASFLDGSLTISGAVRRLRWLVVTVELGMEGGGTCGRLRWPWMFLS